MPYDYDRCADRFDLRYRDGGPAGVARLLRETASGRDAVLEVGCGTGHWLAGLAGTCRVCGLDPSAGMLARAAARRPALPLLRGTAERLPFASGSLELVYCVNALHHFRDPRTFVGEARRVLRAGGALLVIGMDPSRRCDRWYVYDFFPGTLETDLERYPSGRTLDGWMRAAGFRRIESRVAARLRSERRGRAVLDEPTLARHGTSQLGLLSDRDYRCGMERVQAAIAGDPEYPFRVDVRLMAVRGDV